MVLPTWLCVLPCSVSGEILSTSCARVLPSGHSGLLTIYAVSVAFRFVVSEAVTNNAQEVNGPILKAKALLVDSPGTHSMGPVETGLSVKAILPNHEGALFLSAGPKMYPTSDQ